MKIVSSFTAQAKVWSALAVLALVLLFAASPAQAAVIETDQVHYQAYPLTNPYTPCATTDLINGLTPVQTGIINDQWENNGQSGAWKLNDNVTMPATLNGFGSYASVPHAADEMGHYLVNAHDSSSVTYTLAEASNITKIDVFGGWVGGWPGGGQRWTVSCSTDGTTFTELKIVHFDPATSGDGVVTKVSLTGSTGTLASNVKAIKFTFFDLPGSYGGGTYSEIDVLGTAPTTTTTTEAGATTTTTEAGATTTTTTTSTTTTTLAAVTVAISTPSERFVGQRTAANTGTIPITGTYTATPDRIEARAMVMPGANAGTTTAWQTITASPGGGAFSGNLTNVPAGGWYQIEVRSVTGVTPSATATRIKVGVGDIFITAGQSNAANYGPAQSPTNDLVSAFNLNTSAWQVANDPQPYATGSGGSPWPAFGDQLAARTQLPVGIVAVAVGGSYVSEWVPITGPYYPRLNLAINALNNYGGFRAILWHQGESDSMDATTPANYASRLTTIINQTRTDAGFNVPWGVALASWTPWTTAPNEAQVIAGQWQVITNTPGVFKGAETDSYHTLGWLSDVIHFNATGLRDHGRQWSDAVWYSLLNRIPCTNELILTNGTATVVVHGSPGCKYVLQTTTNLMESWSSLSTNVAGTNGLLNFFVPVGSASRFFYRTAQP